MLTEGTILWDEGTQDFDWRVTDALPRSLSGAFKAEPLWLDLSWAKTGEQVSTGDPRFHQGVAMLAARLHGKSLDEIAGEDVRQHRRTRRVTRAAVAALALLTVSSLAGAWFAVQGQRRAERNLAQALTTTDTMVGDVAEGMRNFYGVPQERLAALLGKVEGILRHPCHHGIERCHHRAACGHDAHAHARQYRAWRPAARGGAAQRPKRSSLLWPRKAARCRKHGAS